MKLKKSDQENNYGIKIKENLQTGITNWFRSLTLTPAEDSSTLLTGTFPDQSAPRGFLGTNGAEKSTTIKLLLGLARLTGGSGMVFDKNMRTRFFTHREQIPVGRMILSITSILLGILLLLNACAPATPQPAQIEEITFQSGEFNIVGDLRTPAGTGPFPVVLFVHGSGYADRTMFGMYLPVMERLLDAGYAVFSWDKPGFGESTGQLSNTRVYHQRAQIVLDAIDVMKARSDIDPSRIGLWGISQGGYVMPLALSQSEDIAFMICVSCAGTAGDDQLAYQIIYQAICDGVAEEKTKELSRLLVELDTARTFDTYEAYVHYRQVLDAIADLSPDREKVLDELSQYGVSGTIPEEAWQGNDPEVEDWWNPVRVIEQTKIPILLINGDKDTNGDPVQGVYAWRKALDRAGNSHFRVELLPNVSHFMAVSESSCIEEQSKTFEQVLKDQGYGSIDETLALIFKEPGKHTPLSAWPYTPGMLDLIEEWLSELP